MASKQILKNILLIMIGVTSVGSLLWFISYHEKQYTEKIDLHDVVDLREVDEYEKAQDDSNSILLFGFTIYDSPEEDAQHYLQLLDYLNKYIGCKLRLHITLEEGRLIEKVSRGILQFAFVECGSYIKIREQYHLTLLACALNKRGFPQCSSVIFSSKNSRIRAVEDIRGKRFAFGNIHSTQDHLIPLILLGDHGVLLDDLAHYEYTGSSRDCVNAVISGHFDAGGLRSHVADTMEKEGMIKIICRSKSYPSPCVVAHKKVPAKIVEAVRKALLKYTPSEHTGGEESPFMGGFASAHNKDFSDIEKWAKKLHFIQHE